MRILLIVVALGLAGCGKAPCSASTCATGCCDAAGDCQPGTQAFACGIAAGTCSACSLGQQCLQGACFTGTGGGNGGGAGGGSGGGGGNSCSASNCAGCCDSSGFCQLGTSSATCGAGGASCLNCGGLGGTCAAGICGISDGGGAGGGAGGGGGGGGRDIRLIPQSATVRVYDSIELSAELTGGAPDQVINWSIESGGGQLFPTGSSTATYQAYSANVTVRIRAQANYMSSLAAFANFAISETAEPFYVVPQSFSVNPYVLALSQPQTFTAVRDYSNTGLFFGLRGVEWFAWPASSITDGTLIPTAPLTRVYAREASTNQWASVLIAVQPTTEPSLGVNPAVSTTSPNGVVQLTANVSNGAAVEWIIASPNGGTVSTSGTYTAPSSPGVYVVAVRTLGAIDYRYSAATIVVQ